MASTIVYKPYHYYRSIKKEFPIISISCISLIILTFSHSVVPNVHTHTSSRLRKHIVKLPYCRLSLIYYLYLLVKEKIYHTQIDYIISQTMMCQCSWYTMKIYVYLDNISALLGGDPEKPFPKILLWHKKLISIFAKIS